MGYPLKKILASLPAGTRPPIFIGVTEPLTTPIRLQSKPVAFYLEEIPHSSINVIIDFEASTSR